MSRSLRTWSFDLIATFWIGKANPPCKGLPIISSDQNITILQKKTFANGPSPLVQLKISGERFSTEIAIFIEHQSLQRATCSILRLKRHRSKFALGVLASGQGRAQDLRFGYSKFSKGEIFFGRLKYIFIAHN